jgi:cell wall-associated NlpC family hydrolase
MKALLRPQRFFACVFCVFSVLVILYLPLQPLIASADSMSTSDLEALDNYDNWVSTTCSGGGTAGSCCSGGDTTNGASGTTPSSTYTLDQVKTFASEPITSTWNISDGTVDGWFLKQAGAQATVKKYKLTSTNISGVTSAVEAAGVSPVFFYAYTVNEGGSAGGFINHYGSDVAGGAVPNATRDAQFLATQSQSTNGSAATGGGEPTDMPTAEAQQIYNSLSAGSIGKVYITATSAATAELEDLSGKTGDWTGKFGTPLSGAMQDIQKMGGDPLQGGTASGSCSGGVTGTGMAKAISWAEMIANNNGYGYDQPTRTSGWTKWQADPSCTNQCGSFDCSSFLAAALTEAGYFTTNPEFDTGSESQYLKQAGFTQVPGPYKTSANLQPGDILVNTANHTAMYVGNGQIVQASENENGGVSGGEVGDQNGKEIAIRSYYNFPWDSVWRAPN